MIYYLCDDVDLPGGGRRTIYEHVELLNRVGGMNACVVHNQFPFKPTWRRSTAPITWLDKLDVEPEDWLVVPEIYVDRLETLPKGRKIIFAQGAYIAHPWALGQGNPYRYSEIWGAMVVSSDSFQEMQVFYPRLDVRRVYNSVDNELFIYRAQKDKLIAFNPRKGGAILENVVKGLVSRGVLRGWRIEPATGTPEQVAQKLAEAALCVSCSLLEGFGLMPLEAGLSGCGVVGYSGFGGDEYWEQSGFLRVATGAVREFIQAIEWAAEKGLRTSREAAAWIERNYSRERQERSVCGVWRHWDMGINERPVTVIIPSMGRAKQLRQCIETLIANTPAELEIIVVIDRDQESVAEVQGLPVQVVFRPEKHGALSAWNAGLRVSEHRGEHDLFVLGADDLVFAPGWYEEMIATAETGDYIGLTYYQRGADRWPTHYAVTRQFMIDHLNGSLGMDAYHHNCTDLESWQRALRAGGYVEGRQIIVHNHPAYGTAAIDQTYLDGAFFQEKQDLAHYYERKAQGFPNSWQPAIGPGSEAA